MTTLQEIDNALTFINPVEMRGTKMPFACCQSCGWAYITGEVGLDDETIAFYHEQDADGAFNDTAWVDPEGEESGRYEFDKNKEIENKLYLAWQGHAPTIVRTLEHFGIPFEQPADDSKRFVILPN